MLASARHEFTLTRAQLPARRFPDTVQRDGGAPQVRDRRKHRVWKDPGSAARHFMLRCARDTNALPLTMTDKLGVAL
jgi:hypothetical protein